MYNSLIDLLGNGDIATRFPNIQLRSYFTLEDMEFLAQIRSQKEKAVCSEQQTVN